MEQRLRVICDLLGAEKATDRRLGLKELSEQLDSPSLQQVLDINTAKMLPSGPLKPTTWPGLVDATLRAFEADRKSKSSGGRTTAKGGATSNRAAPGGDPFGTNAAKQLKKLLQYADNEHRSGRRGALARRAAKLFDFVADALTLPGVLSTPAASDYIAILRHNLLGGPPLYAALSNVPVFQDLMACIMARLDELQEQQRQQRLDAEAALGGRSGDGSGVQQRMGLAAAVAAAANEGGLSAQQAEEVSRLLSTLAQLITALPGDLAPRWRGRLAAFWSRLVGWLADCRDVGRLALAALVGMNATLLLEGPDFGSRRAATLYQSAHPFLRRVWAEQRPLPRLKEALAVYCLCTVLLGGLPGPHSGLLSSPGSCMPSKPAAEDDLLQELWMLVAKDIDTDAVKWWDGAVDMSGVAHAASARAAQGATPFSCPPLSRQSLPLAQLAAACVMRRHQQHLEKCLVNEVAEQQHQQQQGGNGGVGGGALSEGASAGGSGGDSGTAQPPPSKRQRLNGTPLYTAMHSNGGMGRWRGGGHGGEGGVQSPVEELAQKVVQAPARWAPVAGLLVAQHPHALSTIVVCAAAAPCPTSGASPASGSASGAAAAKSSAGSVGGASMGEGAPGCAGQPDLWQQQQGHGVAYFGPLLHACVHKLGVLMRSGAHLRAAAPAEGGGGGGGTQGAPTSTRVSSNAASVVWLLRCLCELARAMGPNLASLRQESVCGGGVGSSSNRCRDEGSERQQDAWAASCAWQSVVDAVAEGLCGRSVVGGVGDADAQVPLCVPTLLAAEMATFVVVAVECGVAAPCMPPHQLLSRALCSTGSTTVVVTTGLAATLLRPRCGQGGFASECARAGAGVAGIEGVAGGDSQQDVAARQAVLGVCRELAESPFMVGALGSPGCNPINLGALPSMGGGAISTAALAAADTAVAVLDLDVPTSGSHMRGQLDCHPPSPHDHTWGTRGYKVAHGTRTHAPPAGPSYPTSASPYAPWLLVAQPQAPKWPHPQGSPGLPVIGEEVLELPAWACAPEDEDVIGLQRKLSLLVFGADRSLRVAHSARITQSAAACGGGQSMRAHGFAHGGGALGICSQEPAQMSTALRLQLRLQVLAQATLDLAAIHESLDVMQHGTSSAQVLLRMGGLMLLACKVAAATATDLVTDAHLQQQQQQQQQPPGGDGGAGPSQGGGGGGLLGLAAANLMDSYGLVPNEHHGHGGLRSTEPKGAPASAPSAFAAAAPHSSAAISSTVRQLLGLLLGPHEPWGLSMDEETSQGGSVAAVAAAAAAAAGNGHAHAPKVGWGMAGHVAAGLPQLLGSTAHWLSSMVVEAVATAAMQPAGAPTALAAACPLASLVCPLISRLTPALRHLTAATSSLQALANATLQQHLQRFKPHATSSTTQRGHVRGEGAGAAGMHNQQLDTKQRLLQAVQGAGVDVQTGGQAARRLPPSVPAGSQLRPAKRVLPGTLASSHARSSTARLCRGGLCSQEELCQPVMASMHEALEECAQILVRLAERASEVAQEKLDAENRAAPAPTPELDDDLDMGTTSSLATRAYGPARTGTQLTGSGAPEGGRGILGPGSQLMTPMPSTHVGTAPIGGFGVASSHVSTVIAVGQDPVGHAQQLVLGVMAALAPAHGGAAAAAGLYAWDRLWEQTPSAPTSDLLEGLAAVVAGAVARDPCVGPEGFVLAGRMLAPDLQSEEELQQQGRRARGAAAAPSHILSFKSMTAERILFVLEPLRVMIAAASQRFPLHKAETGPAAAHDMEEDRLSPAGVRGAVGGVGGLFDSDSGSPARLSGQQAGGSHTVSGPAAVAVLEEVLTAAAREAEKLRDRAHASDSLISHLDAWGDADYEEWGPDVGRSRAAGSSAMQMQQQEDEFDIEGNGPWGSAWRLRAAVVAAAGDMIRLDPLRADDSEALEALVVERALPLMKDRRHHVRMAGAGFASRVLLASWENTFAIYEDEIQPALQANGMRCLPGSTGNSTSHGPNNPSPPPEVVSTCVALLAECAHACGVLEVEALAACVEHSAQVPSDSHTIVAGLEELASRLGYGSCSMSGIVRLARSSKSLDSAARSEAANGHAGGPAALLSLTHQPPPLLVAGAGLPILMNAHMQPFLFRWFRSNDTRAPTAQEVNIRLSSLLRIVLITNGTALVAPELAATAAANALAGQLWAAAAKTQRVSRGTPAPSTLSPVQQNVAKAAQAAGHHFVHRHCGAMLAALLQVARDPCVQEAALDALVAAVSSNMGPGFSHRDLLTTFFPTALATTLPGDYDFTRVQQVISGSSYHKHMTAEEQDALLSASFKGVVSQLMLVAQYPPKCVDTYISHLAKPSAQQQQQQQQSAGSSPFASPSKLMSRQDHTPSTAAGAATAAANQEQQLLHLGDEQSDILGCRDQSTVQPPRFGVEDCVDAVVVRVMGAGQSAEERLSKNRDVFKLLLGADVAHVLLEIHCHVLDALPCPRHALQDVMRDLALQRLASLRAFMALLGWRVAEPATCRYLVHILLQLLPHAALQHVVLRMLGSILKFLVLLAHPEGYGLTVEEAAEGKELRAVVQATHSMAWPAVSWQVARATLCCVVQPMASGLSQAAEEASALSACGHAWARCAKDSGGRAAASALAAGALADRDALVVLLRRATLTQGPPSTFALGLLGSLDTLPALPGLEQAVRTQQDLKARVTLPEELQHLTLRIRGMNPAARTRALSALQASMHARWDEIYVQPPCLPQSGSAPGKASLQHQQQQQQQQQQQERTGGSAVLPVMAKGEAEVRGDVVRCAWRLAALAAELSPSGGARNAEGTDHVLAAVAGRLLAAAAAGASKKANGLSLGNPSGAVSAGAALLSAGADNSIAQSPHPTHTTGQPASGSSSATISRRRISLEAAAAAAAAAAANTATAAGGGGGSGMSDAGLSPGLGLGPSVGPHILVRVLEILDGCLVEVANTRVIAAAQAATRAVLSTKSGTDALSAIQAAQTGAGTPANAKASSRAAAANSGDEHLPASNAASHLAAYVEAQDPQEAPGSPPQLPPLFPADLSAPSLWSCTPSGVQTLQNDDGAGPHRKSGQGGCSFESWLCRLAGALITHTKDPLLRMLHGIVVLKAPLAELLMPEILRNLLLYASHEDVMLPVHITEGLAKHVLEPAAACIPELQQTLPRKQLSAMTPDADEGDMEIDDPEEDPCTLPGLRPAKEPASSGTSPSVDPCIRTRAKIDGRLGCGLLVSQTQKRAVRLVISCLEELRLLHIREVVSTEGGRLRGRGGSSGVPAGNEPHLWSRCYCLDLDYLLVAKAALCIQAHLTSFLYTEYWVKHCQGGALRKGLANLLQAAHQHHLQYLHQGSQEQPVPGQRQQKQGSRQGLSGGHASLLRDGGGSLGVCHDPTLLPFLVLDPTPEDVPAAAAVGGKKAQEQQAAGELNMPVQQAAEAETVLRTVWGSSSDPDALHALANQGRAGTDELLMLMEREGDWPGALAAYDLALLQHAHTPVASFPPVLGPPLPVGHGTVRGDPHSARGALAAAPDVSHVHFGVAKALDRMGCGYAAATYLQGAAGPGRQPSLALKPQSEATLELQYELAWRLGHWDSTLPLQGPPTLTREGTGSLCESLTSAQTQPPLAGTQHKGSMVSQGQGGEERPTGLQVPRLDLTACSPTLDQQHSLRIASSSSSSSSSSSFGNKQTGHMGFHESLLACLCALQVGDRQRFHSVLRSATTDCVRALASTSNEAPAALDQPLERLRCLRLLEDVWHVTWSPQTSSPALSLFPLPWDNSPQEQLLQQLCALVDGVDSSASSGAFSLNIGGLRGSELGLGLSFGGGSSSSSGGHLSSRLLDALRCTALRVSGRHGALSCALATGVSNCRSHRSLTQGAAYAQQLRALLTTSASSSTAVSCTLSSLLLPTGGARAAGAASAGERLGGGAAVKGHVGAVDVAELAQLAAMLRPDAGWRLDEARLTWQGGQHKVAARMVRSLADAMLALQAHTKAAAAGAASAHPEAAAPPPLHAAAALLPPNPLQLASALSLAGKWGAKAQLAELGGRSSSPTSIGSTSSESSSGGRSRKGGSADGVLALMTHAAQVAGEQLSMWRASLPPSPPTATSAEATAAMRAQLLPGTNPQAPSSNVSSPVGSAAACKVFYCLAAFADARYSEMVAQRSTPEYTAYTHALKKKKEKGDNLRAQAKVTSSLETRRILDHLAFKTLQPVLADEEARGQAFQLELRFRSIALSNYKRCLQAGHLYDLQVVYRLVAMWLSLSSDPEANAAFGRVFEELPAFKFVPLVYQMASRVSNKEDSTGFQAVLSSLLVCMVCDHPYHALYPLFALKNGSLKNKKLPPDLLSITGGVLEHEVDKDKVEGAQLLLESAAAMGSKETRETISQCDQVVNAYCEISEIKVDKSNHDLQPIAFPQGIWRRMKLATKVAIVSYQLPVDPTCTYADIPYMASTDSKITFAGGVNCPKILKFFDQYGQLHKQLVKAGSDDTRQDAVMQQFFGLVNALLARDREACKRQLGMVTYKVVPFSPIAGLIEWVQNTMPMSEYLIGPRRKEGAHRRHQKLGQISNMVALQEYSAAEQKSAEQRVQVYKAICARFPPVLHHFFLESFHQPASWFAARTTYTRSVAVTSMAGWLIGLGDRHSSNILLDTRTAAVVHIDLGVAFEQGRFLRTPELVPFRMTPDVMDGCGIAGCEGPLRRSCELTMQVLRSSKEALLQVIEVFIHDPLFRWALSHVKAQKRQQEDRHAGAAADEQQALAIMQQQGHEGAGQVVGNGDAERAVLRVKQKLEGVDGSSTSQGVQAQVSSLLAEAQDPEKLSRMFIGWASWV